MVNEALTSAGAQVVLVSSSDEKFPPENIIDGNTETFWISTGMFPQEFIIRFGNVVNISQITIHSYNVKCCKIEKSIASDVSAFEAVAEKEFESTDGHLQANDFPMENTKATHLRFIITSGYDHFISVHKVNIQ